MEALKNYSCKTLSKSAVNIYTGVIRKILDVGNDEEVIAICMEIVAEITNETDIIIEFNENGITFEMIRMVLNEDKNPENRLRYK